MDPQQLMGGGQNSGMNLLTILINIAFGFVAGLMVFLGFQEVITYGEKLAMDLIKMTGYGQQMTALSTITSIAPYVFIAPIAGFALKHLASVRTLKSFAIFAIAVLVGFVIAFFTQSYFTTIIA